MTLSLLELLLGAAATLLLWTLVRSPSPIAILARGLARIVRERAYRTPLLLVLGVLAFDLVQCTFDDRLTALLGYDCTGWIHAAEGDVASAVQKLAWLPAIYVFAFFYVVMFPVITAAPLIYFAATERLRAYRALLFGVIVNYAVCLPFYFFFPVKEMWAGNPAHVSLLLDRLSPAIMEAYRATSALDNCFPSFHTSLALTSALIVRRTCPRAFARAIGASAVIIVASTLYLGIHWALDVAAGTALAVLAARAMLKGACGTPRPTHHHRRDTAQGE